MLGIQEEVSTDASPAKWNEAERSLLHAAIAARQPFIDFLFNRTNANGSQQQFRVSGEPMFDPSCRFIGYRGIGVECTPLKSPGFPEAS